jgi:hypothetical protein
VDLSELNLDVRTYNAVRRVGVTTVEELKQRLTDDPDDLRRGIGNGTFEIVEEALAGVHESAVILENPETHARAYYLRDDTKARLSVIEENYYAVCNNIKEIRDGKLYKELGYKSLEDCCRTEFGVKRAQAYKYISIAERLPEDFVQLTGQIGTEKLSLLAMLDEPTRETVIETVDVENATVKELKAQITALTAERDTAKASLESKDKQFKEAMESKDRQLKAVKESGEHSLNECRDYLNDRIHELENRIHEMENAPIDHDMTDADAAEEIKRLKRELEDEQLKTIMLEKAGEAKARRAADAVRHELTQMHETELQTLREGYEKQLAEESKKPDRSALDRAKFYALKNVFEEIVDELENLLDELHDDPRIRYINELDNYWTDNLLYLKREGEGAGA